MKKFIKTIAYFIIPIFLLIAVQFYIDPYNIIRQEKNATLKELKKHISYKINYALYKLQDYYWHPTDIIILGDSRANHLTKKSFNTIAHEKISNLAYGGGTIQEIVETFWIVNKMHTLKKVYIGINFNLYSALNTKNSVKQANILRKSIIPYLLSKYSIKSTILMLKSILKKEKIEIEKPPYSRENFWKYQLKVSGPNFYKNYKYPSKYYNDLKNISDYCSTHNIKLVFFIPPTHTDLQTKIKEFHLENYNEKFKKDLISFNVPVFDFNFENKMTKNKENFGDPFHFRTKYEKIIISIISDEKKRTHKNLYKLLSK